MRRFATTVGSMALVAVLPLPGQAQESGKAEPVGIYTAIGIGVGFGSSIGIDDAPSSAFSNETFTTNTTVGPNVAVGYAFPGAWRAEVEYLGLFAGATNTFTESGKRLSASGYQVATNAVQFNLLKDIPTGSRFTPYIGGGLGFAATQYNVPDAGSATGTTFAGQGKVGVAYALSPSTSVYLGYRIMGIGGGTDLSFFSDQPTTKTRVQQSLDAGFRFRLR